MTQQSRICTESYRRIAIAFSLVVFLSATIVAVANTSWPNRFVSGVTHMIASVSPVVNNGGHYVMKGVENYHLWKLVTEIGSRKHVRIIRNAV